MAYIGNIPAESYSAFQKQDFTTSATTSYTLDNPVANANELALFINFVRQEPTTAYSASGTSLTLTSATSSSDDMYCVYLGKAVQTVNPPNASVGTSQLVDGAVTSAKLSSGKILQVVQGTANTQVATTSVGYVDTGLSASITPSSSSNKILILVQQSFRLFQSSSTVGGNIKLLRDTTDIYNETKDFGVYMRADGSTVIQQYNSYCLNYLDSPSSTSSIAYKTQQTPYHSGDEFYTQPSSMDSSIILMEVSG